MKYTILVLSMACVQALGASPSPQVDAFTLKKSKLTDAVHLVSAASGIPVVCTPEAADKEVTVFFSEISLEASLQAMCRAHGLWMNLSPEGVMIISTLEQHLASQSVYSGDYMESITIKYPSVYDVGDALKGLFRDRLVWERPDGGLSDPIENIERALDRMDTLSGRSQFGIQTQTGGNSSSSRSSSRSSSLRSSSRSSLQNHGSGEELQQLQSMQTHDDFMREQMQKSAASGMNGAKMNALIYLSALPEVNTLLIRSSDRDAVQLVQKSVEEMDKPRGQVLLRVLVLAVTLDDSVSTGLEWLFEEGDVSGGFADSPIQTLSQSISDYTINSPVVSSVTDSLKMRVKALAEKESVRTLASPALLVADNEAATVFVGKDAKFLDQIEPGTVVNTDGGITTTDPTPTFIDRNIGLSLLITPRVHADRSITLRIMQERSEAAANLRSIDYGGDRPVKVQDIEQEIVASTLVAMDGSLVVLGGLISEANIETESGIPLLKDIPFLGRLFMQKTNQKKREELMVLIRPTVLAVPGEEGAASRILLDNLKVKLDESVNSSRFDTAVDALFERPEN